MKQFIRLVLHDIDFHLVLSFFQFQFFPGRCVHYTFIRPNSVISKDLQGLVPA